MGYLSILKIFEKLTEEEQLDKIVGLLEEAGFKAVKCVSSQGNVNIFYSKDGVNAVFCVVYDNIKGMVSSAVMDRDVYDTIFRGTDRVLTLKERNAEDFKMVCSSGGYNNASLHWIVTGEETRMGYGVDHITHNLGINMRKYLRFCTNLENNCNKKFYSKIYKNGRQFSFPNTMVDDHERIALADKGYHFTKWKVRSPKFKTKDEMLQALNKLEDKILKGFRYNPLLDFSKTWYALVFHEVLGLIDKAELHEYNRGYFCRYDSEVAHYYQL